MRFFVFYIIFSTLSFSAYGMESKEYEKGITHRKPNVKKPCSTKKSFLLPPIVHNTPSQKSFSLPPIVHNTSSQKSFSLPPIVYNTPSQKTQIINTTEPCSTMPSSPLMPSVFQDMPFQKEEYVDSEIKETKYTRGVATHQTIKEKPQESNQPLIYIEKAAENEESVAIEVNEILNCTHLPNSSLFKTRVSIDDNNWDSIPSSIQCFFYFLLIQYLTFYYEI